MLNILSWWYSFRFLWPCIVIKVWRERKPTRCNNQMFIINFRLNMFRASLCPSSGEQRPCVTACVVLRWFCWMWLVAVVGHCVVGCEHCSHPTNMLRRRLIINIWLLYLVGFLSFHTMVVQISLQLASVYEKYTKYSDCFWRQVKLHNTWCALSRKNTLQAEKNYTTINLQDYSVCHRPSKF